MSDTVAPIAPARPAPRKGRRRRPSGQPPPLPHHLRTTGFGWLISTVVFYVLAIIYFARGLRGVAIPVTVADDAIVRAMSKIDFPGFLGTMRAINHGASWWVIVPGLYAVIAAQLLLRRWRHLVLTMIVYQVMGFLAISLSGITTRPRPFGVPIRAHWGGWSLPALPITGLAMLLLSALYTLVPEGRSRNICKWVAGAMLALAALAELSLGLAAPTDIIIAIAIGVSLPLLVFRRFAPGDLFPINYNRGRAAHLDVGGERGAAIHTALEEQLGLRVTEVKPFGLAGSAGSTPLRIRCDGDPPTYLFGKLYARSHMRSDRWYKLGRELLYGRLEDEKPFNTVRRLVQQEDYALRVMRSAGVSSAEPFGFVELTPEREYLLVTGFFEGATELGEAEIDDDVIDDALRMVRRMWDAGLAHRDVKPANVLVRDGQALLIDVAFAEVRPSPWRQAVDLANMMLCLGLRVGADRVYARALLQFSEDEITEAFAAARGLALPSQLRRAIRAEGHDLHAQFLRLLPAIPPPIKVQRWNARRIGLWGIVLVIALILTINLPQMFSDVVGTNTALHTTEIGCTDTETLALEAQAVPTASQIPCINELPTGWRLKNVTADRGKARYVLSHDRAGNTAMVARLSATCDTSGLRETSEAPPGVRRFLQISEGAPFGVRWHDVFPGGCVSVNVRSISKNGPVNGTVFAEAIQLVQYTSRTRLAQAVEDRTDGRLHLDPTNKA